MRKLVLFAALASVAVTWAGCPGSNQPAGTEVIVDNRDPGCQQLSGGWAAADASNGNGAWGPDFLYLFGDPANLGLVRFTPTVTATGNYDVFIWWSADSDRTEHQPVLVYDANGLTPYNVNLRLNGHQWFLLGMHRFNQGTTGHIDFNNNDTDGYANADAIRLVPVM